MGPYARRRVRRADAQQGSPINHPCFPAAPYRLRHPVSLILAGVIGHYHIIIMPRQLSAPAHTAQPPHAVIPHLDFILRKRQRLPAVPEIVQGHLPEQVILSHDELPRHLPPCHKRGIKGIQVIPPPRAGGVRIRRPPLPLFHHPNLLPILHPALAMRAHVKRMILHPIRQRIPFQILPPFPLHRIPAKLQGHHFPAARTRHIKLPHVRGNKILPKIRIFGRRRGRMQNLIPVKALRALFNQVHRVRFFLILMLILRFLVHHAAHNGPAGQIARL